MRLYFPPHVRQAYVACLAGSSLREYYDDPTVLKHLDQLYVFAWSDPAAPLLEVWRGCFMISIYESAHPFARVPHIVINGTLPNAPWDTEAAVVPEQDERFLTVPMWTYMDSAEEQEEEVDADDAWYAGDDEEEVHHYAASWSESEEDFDEASTPSPPSWPNRAFPTSTGRRAPMLDDVFEEDEDAGEVPSVLEARFRRSWLKDDDEEEEDSPSLVHRTRAARFTFSTTLSDIGEITTPEEVYRPLAPDYKSLWTADAMLPASQGRDADARTAQLDSADDGSLYMDALDQIDDSEAESQYVDAEQPEDTEDENGSHAHEVPRPSCDLFLNDEDDDAFELPRGKANIPAGKTDWFDLLDDSDLGSPGWGTPPRQPSPATDDT